MTDPQPALEHDVPAPPRVPPLKRLAAHALPLAAAAAVLALCLPRGGGEWLGFFVAAYIVWALIAGVRMLFSKQGRRMRAVRLAGGAAVLMTCLAAQTHWDHATRRHADEAVAAILGHKSRTGAYPARLGETGLDEASLSTDWSVVYELRDGEPQLSYPATLMPLTTLEYDFTTRRWKTNSY